MKYEKVLTNPEKWNLVKELLMKGKVFKEIQKNCTCLYSLYNKSKNSRVSTKIFIYIFFYFLTMSYENRNIDKPNSISNSNQQKNNVTKAKRLTFSYENNNIKLIDEQKINKIIPPSVPLTELENKSVNFLLESI